MSGHTSFLGMYGATKVPSSSLSKSTCVTAEELISQVPNGLLGSEERDRGPYIVTFKPIMFFDAT